MKRDLKRLANDIYDMLVIGGGITGACVAWDATLRGLRVALVEKGDFGGATSANSLKTAHGGLRYLQDGNLRLIRMMIRERKALLQIAPHLVHPLPVLMPTYRNKLSRSKLLLGSAVKVNDLVSFDRNWNMDPDRALPPGRVISAAECLNMAPGLEAANLSGGVIWYDAQIYNTERLVLAFLISASRAGAQVANYVAATEFSREGRRVVGVKARDELTSVPLKIRARVVVNSAGPWVDEVLSGLNGQAPPRMFRPSTAMNLVTRQILSEFAIGFDSYYTETLADGSTERRSRVLFVAPWRHYSLVGTIHAPCDGGLNENWVTEACINSFLAEVNCACGWAGLRREDVYLVHRGFLPAAAASDGNARVKLLREGQLYDHEIEDGVEGLITVVGVKYTAARSIAEKAVNLVFRKLRRRSPLCQTHHRRLHGGQVQRFADFVARETITARESLAPESVRPVLYNHGSEYHQLLRFVEEDPGWGRPVSPDSHTIRAEIVHAVRSEMARKLSDVVLRRTELGSAGPPGENAMVECAQIMAAEFGWDKKSISREIDAVWAYYATMGAAHRVTFRI